MKFAIKDFIDDREFKNLSPVSIENYNRTLNEFHDFCVEQEIVDVKDVTPNIIKKYLMYCQKQRKNNPTSINTKLHNLKIFFNYLQEAEIISENKNPTKKIDYVKADVKIDVFTDEQVKQMLNYYSRMKYREKSFYAYRDYTIILTLLGTGVRLGELCNLTWNNINFKNQTITVIGKKRQQSSVPITDKLKKELTEYYVFLQQHFENAQLGFVFTNKYNERLTPNAVKNIFKRLKKIMNFKDARVSAHSFRHYFSVTMIRSGADAFTLQRMLRHSDLKMTMRYVNLFGTALAEQNEKYNPLNKLNI
ncbi:tyrosine-type recombinase/integrase [Sporotomaculum syntrophicum]|nr:tyrosine-type recombinase/integrase [Sporotomaculum syntrophicum]